MVGLLKKMHSETELSQTGHGLLSGLSSFCAGRLQKRVLLPVFVLSLIALGLFHTNDKPVGANAASSMDMGALRSSSDGGQLRQFVRSNPDNLLRMIGADVTALMAEPELVRYDFPTVVWQYRKEGCVLDLYFASVDADVSSAPVVHYETRTHEVGEVAAAGCLRDMIAANRQMAMADVPDLAVSDLLIRQ